MSNLRLLVFALAVVGASSWSSAQDPPDPVYFTRSFQFEDVDISRVAAQLRTFGIPIPVALQGTASVEIMVSIPLNQLTNGRAYRVQGSLQSPQLQVDRYSFGNLSVVFTIANGLLSLTEVEGQFLEPSDTAEAPPTAGAAERVRAARVLGSFAGEASVELLPLGQLKADLRVEDVDARILDQFFTESIPGLAGVVDGEIQLTAPVERIGKGIAYTATATLAAERLAYAELSVTEATANLRLNQGIVKLTSLALDLDGVSLQGSASIRLVDTADVERGWSAAVQTKSAKVAELLEWLAGAAPEKTSGSVSFAIEASGPLDGSDPADATEPAGWRAAGTIAGSEIFIGGFHIGELSHQLQVSAQHLSLEPTADADVTDLLLQTLRAHYRSDDRAITLQNLSLQGWNGQLSGEAIWSLLDTGQHRAELDWSGFEFAFLSPASLADPTTIQTTTRGQIQWMVPAARLEFPASHVFTLRANVGDIHTDELAFGALEVSLDAGQIPWQLRGSGQLLEVPAKLSATLQIPAASSWDELASVPGSSSLVAGPFALSPLLDRMSDDAEALDVPTRDTDARDADVLDADARDGGAEASLRGTAAFRIDAVLTGEGPPQMTAELAVEELGYGGSRIAETFVAATRLKVQDGRLWLSDLRAELSGTNAETPPLAFAGQAVAELSPLGELTFDVSADAVDLVWFNPWIPDGMGPFDGTAQGTVRASVPLADISRVAAWQGEAVVASPKWQMGEFAIRQSSAELVLQEAVLVAEPIYGITNGVALAGRVAVELETDTNPGGAWQARLQTGNARAADVFSLFGATPTDEMTAETSGFVSFDVDASGQAAEAEEVSWQAAGELSAEALQIAGFEIGRLRHHLSVSSQQVRLEPLPAADPSELQLIRLAADYRAGDLGYELRDLRFEGWGGTLTGNVLWSRDPQQEHRAEIAWSGLRIPIPLELVGADSAEEVDAAEEDAALQTLTAGSLAWSAPPTALSNPAAHRFTLQADARELRGRGVEFGELQLHVDALDPNWEIRGEGTLLNGPAELTAAIDVARAESWAELSGAPANGKLAVGPMQLGDLFRLWQPEEGAEGWSGVATLQWTFASDGQSPPQSLARARIENLSYRNQSLTDRLEIELASAGGEFDLHSVRGTYAGGRIDGSGRWTLGTGPRQLVFRLSSIDASRALLPVVATSGDWFDGRLSADLVVSGRDGPRDAGGLRVSGRMELRNGETFGLQSQSLRARIQGAVSLPSLRWSLQLSDLQANRGRGRVVGRLRVDQSRVRSDRVDLDSEFEARDLDFQDVLSELSGGGPPAFGSGSLTGTVALSGRAIESFADLEGRVVGQLGGTDAAAVPGLLSAQNYLGVLSLRNTEFNRGEIEARLRHGELQILELWLASDQLRVWADGSVSLRSGRLDIDAVAATGDFDASNPALLTLARTLALEATLPISVITRANELLSNRVVYLSLGGTYQRPAVRVRPGTTLTQNAARFFLREAAGIALPASGTAD